MIANLQELCWPVSRLGEALVGLASKSRLLHGSLGASGLPRSSGCDDDETLAAWIRGAAASLGVQAEPAVVNYGQVERFLRRAGPALLRLNDIDGPRFLGLLGMRRGLLLILGPDLTLHKLPVGQVSSALCQKIEAPLQGSVERLLEVAGGDISAQKYAKMRAALLRERLGAVPITGLWPLRLSPGAPFLAQIRQAGLRRAIASIVLIYTVQYLLGLVAWWVMGRNVLEGRFDPGWLLAWVLIVLTLLPLQVLATWYQGMIAIGGSGLLKRRLLYGALRLEAEDVRNQGAGQLLGRVIESEAVESLALSAGFLGVLAGIELVIAVAVLWMGAGGWFQTLLYFAWIAVTLRIGWGLWNGCEEWTTARLEMTHDLVEKMVGHRTRLAQELDGQWHEDEDQIVKHYLELSRAIDRSGALMSVLVPQGWLIVGMLGLVPAFISGASPGKLAVGLGGMLLASSALQKISSGFLSVAGASIAWERVSPLFHAAGRPDVLGSPAFACAHVANGNEAENGRAILEARDLVFRHRGRGEPVLQGLNLQILHNERLLLEGASGSGKSTLAAVLSGLRLAESGAILLGGLDWKTLGSEGWRKRIVMVPQFHENRVLTETLAFNLLMGRRWPPEREDLAEAKIICQELGLNDLLERMPAGIFQTVGEHGWQLSHGERSRVYIARALLQRADLVIFDESFGALDPESLLKALRCVSQRAGSLMVIAHP